jgi:DNA-binding NarL/FixJ family response regulator
MSDAQTPPIRIVLIDDHQIIRDGLREFIESRQGMLVVGDAGDRAGALEVVTREQPDVVVLDLDLGGFSGLDLLPELIKVAEGASIIILTGLRDMEKRDRAMELGAKGVVLKENGVAQLLNAIEKVHRTGDYWFEPGAARRLMENRRGGSAQIANPEAGKIAGLTPTERSLITYLGKGLDNKQISKQMNMAESTVRNNLTRIYDKLDIKGGRLALLVYAYQHGLVKPSS